MAKLAKKGKGNDDEWGNQAECIKLVEMAELLGPARKEGYSKTFVGEVLRLGLATPTPFIQNWAKQ